MEACKDHKVDPSVAYDKLGYMLGEIRASSQSTPSANVAVTAPKAIALTPQQADEARRIAREEKASRMGVTSKEVNLTSAEAKKAKEMYRLKLQGVGQKPATGQQATKQVSTGKGIGATAPSPSSGQPLVVNIPQVKRPKEGKAEAINSDLTGSRATAKTRLDNFRRICLKQNPIASADPVVLHLVAYSNHRRKLAAQWEKFKNEYSHEGMLDPLRGLPDPWKMEVNSRILESVTKFLRPQADSPEIFVLQTEAGSSFWDRDMPSQACPEFLRVSYPGEAYNEFEAGTHVTQ